MTYNHPRTSHATRFRLAVHADGQVVSAVERRPAATVFVSTGKRPLLASVVAVVIGVVGVVGVAQETRATLHGDLGRTLSTATP